MFRRRFLSFPMVIGAVIIGVVSGNAIFGPPLQEYWQKKLKDEAAAKENRTTSSTETQNTTNVGSEDTGRR